MADARALADSRRASIRICGVVVCFEPELGTVSGTIRSLAEQVDATLVVDNGSPEPVGAWLVAQEASGVIRYRRQASNLGLAAGHNVGIAWAGENGFSHVLLLDQDSWPQPGMVASLACTLLDLTAQGRRVAAVGPSLLIDAEREAFFPFIRLGLLGNRSHLDPRSPGSPVKVDILISSGSLIPLSVIDVVGAMDEGLFIDNVDMDWCFRAAYHGFELFGDRKARMLHKLGDRVYRVWLFRWRNVIVHGSVRLYYMMRNRLKLYSRPHTPWLWIVQDWYRLVSKFLLFALIVSPRRKNIGMMLRGLADGLRGKNGAFQQKLRRSRASMPPPSGNPTRPSRIHRMPETK